MPLSVIPCLSSSSHVSRYVRYEVQKRLAAFYLISVLVGGFSNILAYGLMQMEGVGGQRGWQWIFVSITKAGIYEHVGRLTELESMCLDH